MEEQFSFKSFENVRLKATYNIEVNGRTFEAGETIAIFDKIQIAGLTDTVARTSAKGGFDNRSHVFWETTTEQRLTFSQGIMNATEFALLLNANVVEKASGVASTLTLREFLESDESGVITLSHTPTKNIFLYNKSTGDKMTFTQSGNTLTTSSALTDVIVDYCYDYTDSTRTFNLGQRFLNGFLELEGMTRVKDDTTGQVVTGLIRIPHLRLMSDLSIRLGAQANPVVANFTAVGVPVGSRGNSYISEFCLLSDDISSDL